MPHSSTDWYDTPQYYDYIFDDDTIIQADFLLAAYQRHALNPRPKPVVLEPACGSGRLVAALSPQVHCMHGFDLNQNMLRYAEERPGGRQKNIKLWQDRLESFTTPLPPASYDLAHCLVTTFKYLLSEEHAIAHLHLAAQSLRRGGIYVLGFHLSDYNREKPERERWAVTRDSTEVVCNIQTWPPDRQTRLERVRSRLSASKEGKVVKQETTWHFRTYNAAQVRSMLRAVPELECVACYDFRHDLNQSRKLDDEYSDLILILQKRD